MRKTALLELIGQSETSEVELRSDTITNDVFAKEVVALLNFQGGRMILGIDDDGSVVGLTRDRLEEWIMTTCRDKIRPELIPTMKSSAMWSRARMWRLFKSTADGRSIMCGITTTAIGTFVLEHKVAKRVLKNWRGCSSNAELSV